MKTQKLVGNITVSKPSGADRETVNITVQDENSRIQFLDLEMDLTDFARALMGQGYVPCAYEVRGLDQVGMIKEMKPLSFEVPDDVRFQVKEWAIANCQKFAEEGWTANASFSSQGSFVYNYNGSGTMLAKTSQIRYVENTKVSETETDKSNNRGE